MAQESFAVAFRRIMGKYHVARQTIEDYLEPEPKRARRINNIASTHGLRYEDRVYLLGLKGMLPEELLLTEEELGNGLARIHRMIDHNPAPMGLIDYKHRILRVNATILDVIRNLPLPPILGEDLQSGELSLFELIFDDEKYGLKSLLGTYWKDIARDTILDFMTFNLLRQHEDFYREYPECIAHLPSLLEVWDEVRQSPMSAFDQIVEKRHTGESYTPFRVESGGELPLVTFTIAVEALPILANRVRVVRFIPIPYDFETNSIFSSTRPPVNLTT